MPQNRIIFPLDVSSLGEATRWCETLRGEVGLMKVGLELFTQHGPEAVAYARRFGHEIMLDLKLHDIPATVEKAAQNAASLGSRFITVHASGGPAMLKATVKGAQQGFAKTTVLAVTVLTSMTDDDLSRTLGFALGAQRLVEQMAMMAWEAGVTGFVCSPLEVATLRRLFGQEATIVVPGVRPLGADDNDQKRVATPASAMKDGADYLVIGRPIRNASDPVAASRAIAEEIRPYVTSV